MFQERKSASSLGAALLAGVVAAALTSQRNAPACAWRSTPNGSGSRLAPFCSIRNRLLGEPSDIVNHASAADGEMVTQLTESFLPGSLRAGGIINDIAVSNPDLNRGYPFAEIGIPALIFHAKDDRWGAFAMAKEAAERIPGVQFRAIESGGNLLLGSRQAVGAEIAQFVREHARATPSARVATGA